MHSFLKVPLQHFFGVEVWTLTLTFDQSNQVLRYLIISSCTWLLLLLNFYGSIKNIV